MLSIIVTVPFLARLERMASQVERTDHHQRGTRFTQARAQVRRVSAPRRFVGVDGGVAVATTRPVPMRVSVS